MLSSITFRHDSDDEPCQKSHIGEECLFRYIHVGLLVFLYWIMPYSLACLELQIYDKYLFFAENNECLCVLLYLLLMI